MFLFFWRVLPAFRVNSAKSLNNPEFSYPDGLFWSIVGLTSGQSEKRGARANKIEKSACFNFEVFRSEQRPPRRPWNRLRAQLVFGECGLFTTQNNWSRSIHYLASSLVLARPWPAALSPTYPHLSFSVFDVSTARRLSCPRPVLVLLWTSLLGKKTRRLCAGPVPLCAQLVWCGVYDVRNRRF